MSCYASLFDSLLLFIILIPASQVSDSLQVDTGEMIWYGEGLHTRICSDTVDPVVSPWGAIPG